jgi:hypothetical protein
MFWPRPLPPSTSVTGCDWTRQQKTSRPADPVEKYLPRSPALWETDVLVTQDRQQSSSSLCASSCRETPYLDIIDPLVENEYQYVFSIDNGRRTKTTVKNFLSQTNI